MMDAKLEIDRFERAFHALAHLEEFAVILMEHGRQAGWIGV